jgi:hypothetical protein
LGWRRLRVCRRVGGVLGCRELFGRFCECRRAKPAPLYVTRLGLDDALKPVPPVNES